MITDNNKPNRTGHLLVACEPADISDDAFNGLAVRHAVLFDRLLEKHHVHFLAVRRGGVPYGPIADRFANHVVADVTCPSPSGRRAKRFAALCHEAAGKRPAVWEQRVLEAARRVAPDAVLTVGPWLDREYRRLSRPYPTMHLLEEDMAQMVENAPQSQRAKMFRWLLSVLGRLSGPTPRIVVTISQREARNARSRYRRARVEVLPEIVPHECWFDGTRQPRVNTVLVVGNLTEARHVEGLIPVLEALSAVTNVSIEIISDKGLHPRLQGAVAAGRVLHRPAPRPLRIAYEEATVAFVPAQRATGMKGTLLRAWAAGCPVVTYQGSSETVGATDGINVLARSDPQAVADAIVGLLNSPSLQAQLSENARSVMRERFEPSTLLAEFDGWVGELMEVPSGNRRRSPELRS